MSVRGLDPAAGSSALSGVSAAYSERDNSPERVFYRRRYAVTVRSPAKCAVVLDAYSRRVVGWSIDSSPTATLVANALGMAIDARNPQGTVIHSDPGGGVIDDPESGQPPSDTANGM